MDEEHEEGHGQGDGELQQRRHHRAQHAALDRAVAVQSLPGHRIVMSVSSS